jgi:hypothetical protein
MPLLCDVYKPWIADYMIILANDFEATSHHIGTTQKGINVILQYFNKTFQRQNDMWGQ